MKYISLAILLLISSQCHAVEWTIHGGLKNETAYFIAGQKRLDKMQNTLDIKPEATLSDRWQFRGRFLGRYDAAMDILPSNTSDLTPGIQQHYRFYTQSKEAYLLYTGDDFDFRIGQQQIVWGKTDGLRMLDTINPLDMREFILDDFLDSRIGLWSARLNWYTDVAGIESEFEFIVVPDARPVALAPQGSRWAYPMPAGVSASLQSGVQPSWRPSDIEAGIAWRANVSGWDLSLNGFHGWKDTPNMLKQFTAGGLNLTPSYQRMNTVGGSFSNAFGAIVLRGELAANIGEVVSTTGTRPTTSIVKTSTFNGAIGLEYNKHNWRISPQFFIRHLSNWNPTIAEDQNSGFMSLLLATDYLNEKLKPEMIGLFDWAAGSWMLRPKVSYEFNDHLITRAGLDLFGGKAGFFGPFNANDRVASEVEYTF